MNRGTARAALPGRMMAKMEWIDLRSDTVTEPTEAMRRAMAEAAVGDDVYEDDPTMKELEELAARMAGKEAALFVPSGTFGNQLALFTHCPRGSEVVAGENCHIVEHEAGGAAIIAGVTVRTVPTRLGYMDPALVERVIRKTDDIHYPVTSLIAVENAQADGTVMSLENLRDLRVLADRYGLPIHMDGARLFNAAAALGVSAAQVAENVDSVMFCLSKGMCAPVGSMLAGGRAFIEAARRKRKVMGGGLRQAGVLAAPGIVALKEMAGRLAEDHKNADLLASQLAKLPGVAVDLDRRAINMVYFTLRCAKSDLEIQREMRQRGIKISTPENGVYRFVTHYWVTADDVKKAVAAFGAVIA